MDYKNMLKKYWFVLLIGVILIVFVVIWSVNSNEQSKNKIEEMVQTKQENGKYILFSVDGENGITADDFYKNIDENSINYIVLDQLFESLADKEIPATEKMKTEATNWASYYLTNNTEEQIEELMRNNGLTKYGNLTTYYEKQTKKQELVKKYMTDHFDDVTKPYIDENQIRGVSHILIKVEDVEEITDENGNVTHVAHPTDEEKKKLDDVLEALKTRDFADVASEFSEDEGSASNGGSYGFQKDSDLEQYVEEFKKTIRELEFDTQSEVITTTYGYHIIKTKEYTKEEFDNDLQVLYDIINDNDGKEYYKLIDEYSKKYNVEIVDSKLKEEIENHIKDEEKEENTEDVAEETNESEGK